MNLAPNAIHVWLAFDREFHDEETLRAFGKVLSPEEQARHSRLGGPDLRHQYLVTRALQRSVLSNYSAGIAPEEWRFETSEHGRPSLARGFAGAGLHFNIAHTPGLVAMAISRHAALGVDVEHLGTRRVPFNVARRYFSDIEARELAELPDSERRLRFFALWTLKESWLKATGQGLAGGLERVCFNFDSALHASAVAVDDDNLSRWQFWQAVPSPEYLLALALRSEVPDVVVRLFRSEPGVALRGTPLDDPRRVAPASEQEQGSQP